MKIILLRHAEAINDELTQNGLSQIDFAVLNLKNENIAKVYYSSFNRAKQTAFLVSEKLKLENLQQDARIREREHFANDGSLEFQEFDDNYLNPSYSHHNPEGCKEFVARVFDFLDEVVENHKKTNDTVLVVGHSCLLYAFIAYFNGLNSEGKMNWVKMGNCATVTFLLK